LVNPDVAFANDTPADADEWTGTDAAFDVGKPSRTDAPLVITSTNEADDTPDACASRCPKTRRHA